MTGSLDSLVAFEGAKILRNRQSSATVKRVFGLLVKSDGCLERQIGWN